MLIVLISRLVIRLPEEFVLHVQKLEKQIDAHLNKLNTHIQRGNLALEVYKRRTCSGDLDVDYMDSMLYGQICLETGDFTPYCRYVRPGIAVSCNWYGLGCILAARAVFWLSNLRIRVSVTPV